MQRIYCCMVRARAWEGAHQDRPRELAHCGALLLTESAEDVPRVCIPVPHLAAEIVNRSKPTIELPAPGSGEAAWKLG